MQKTYNIQLNTPAFLGGADQTAQWRTPPFKSLIRRWWRVLKAKEYNYDHARIREAEGEIFGHTDLKHKGKNWAMKSPVRITLSNWNKGSNKNWPEKQLGTVQASTDSPVINSGVYTGFGAIDFKSKQPIKPWLDDNNIVDLIIQNRSSYLSKEEIDQVFYLINWLGSIGSRSTNGWGSLNITGVEYDNYQALLEQVSRPLEDCLQVEWGHAIGITDGWKTVWETKEFTAWEEAVNELARIMATMRIFAKQKSEQARQQKTFSYIHLLGLPASGHWSLNGNTRWPCQIKMKVFRTESNRFKGVIYHLPHNIPQKITDELRSSMPVNEQINFWKEIHHLLDQETEVRYE